MAHPLVYEINTRCWLRELAAQLGSNPDRSGLGSVPDSEFERWRNLGFTHIWLMGVWPTGPRSRAAALAEPTCRRSFSVRSRRLHRRARTGRRAGAEKIPKATSRSRLRVASGFPAQSSRA